MSNALLDFQASLKEAVSKASVYTAGLERRPYAVSAVLIGAGYALTASHVVGDDGAGLILPGGASVQAAVAGRDSVHDLALLKLEGAVDAGEPKLISLGVGDLALILKRDPFDGVNAELSMVSAAGEKLGLGGGGAVERYIQVAAGRMPGSTGGPVAAAGGELAGVQTFNRHMGSEIAIPSDLALKRAALMKEKGSIKRPYLGMKSQRVPLPQAVKEALSSRQEAGLLIMSVEPGSPAAKGGLGVGDILVGFGGSAVSDHDELITAMAEKGAGASVKAEVSRGGSLTALSFVLGGA